MITKDLFNKTVSVVAEDMAMVSAFLYDDNETVEIRILAPMGGGTSLFLKKNEAIEFIDGIKELLDISK